MPRGGKRENSGALDGNSNAKIAQKQTMPRGGKRENSGAIAGNSNALRNKGGAAPLRNSNSLGKGAPIRNSNSSSRAKKISTLFAMGVELDYHGEFLKAISKYREVIELEPKHADAHNCIARLMTLRYYQGDFFNSGSFLQIAEHYKIADSGGCTFAKKNLYVLLFNGENGENGEFKPSPENYKEIVEHFKLIVSKAEAEYQELRDNASLLAAAFSHNQYAQVVFTCSTTENFAANIIIAESESRIAVAQDPSCSKYNADLASILTEANNIMGAIDYFKKALVIKPNCSYALEMLKSLQKQVNVMKLLNHSRQCNNIYCRLPSH